MCRSCAKHRNAWLALHENLQKTPSFSFFDQKGIAFSCAAHVAFACWVKAQELEQRIN